MSDFPHSVPEVGELDTVRKRRATEHVQQLRRALLDAETREAGFYGFEECPQALGCPKPYWCSGAGACPLLARIQATKEPEK